MRPPIATWPDGLQHPVHELTVARCRAAVDVTGEELPTKKTFFKGRTQEGELVVVRDREDKGIVVSLRVNDAQRCQSRPGRKHSHESCKAVMAALAQKIVDGTVGMTRDELFDERDKLFETMGFTKNVMKRPAAAKAAPANDVGQSGEEDPTHPPPLKRRKEKKRKDVSQASVSSGGSGTSGGGVTSGGSWRGTSACRSRWCEQRQLRF